ncbi:thioesterase II family protein [Streptomyces sp. NPDC088116]|uniref:thioesterase II family protein n=1 Tax=Streptomyces sp. NPDC088116 TaxID=3365825 RepID=UPI003824B117
MSYDKGQITSRWFQSSAPRPDAAIRLFVLPYGGGSAVAYSRWASLFPADVELQAVQLPGRQGRRNEEVFTEVEPLVEALYDAVEGELDGRPFAFFGHSMGAMLSYRLTVAMESEGGPSPALLAVSGWAGAAHRTSPVPIKDLSDDEFISRIQEFGALPPEITENEELRELVLPALRADFSVINDYSDDAAPVSCPVVAYGGKSDPLLENGSMATWAGLSEKFLGLGEFPGSHFYLFEHALSVATDLGRHLRRAAGTSSRG